LIVLGYYILRAVIPLLNSGVTVKYQRVTGPEFVILNDGENIIANSSNQQAINKEEFFVTDDLDNRFGYLKGKKYRLTGEVVGTKKISPNTQSYLLIKIKVIKSIEEYYLALFILTILFLLIVFLFSKIWYNKC